MHLVLTASVLWRRAVGNQFRKFSLSWKSMFFTKFVRHVPVLLKIEKKSDILHEAAPAFFSVSLPRLS
jgi:hypothetical protein